MSIEPLKVSSVRPLSRAGACLFPSKVRHVSGGPEETLSQRRNSRGHITWEDVSNGLALVFGVGYQIPVP